MDCAGFRGRPTAKRDKRSNISSKYLPRKILINSRSYVLSNNLKPFGRAVSKVHPSQDLGYLGDSESPRDMITKLESANVRKPQVLNARWVWGDAVMLTYQRIHYFGHPMEGHQRDHCSPCYLQVPDAVGPAVRVQSASEAFQFGHTK